MTQEVMNEFKKKVQSLLPGYIIVDVFETNNCDGVEVLFRYIDNATVSEVIKFKDNPTFDFEQAKDVVIAMIDRSIQNIKYHMERLEKLKQSVIDKTQ